VLGSILILLAASGVPMSQIFRIADVTPAAAQAEETPRQYQLVFAGAFSDAAENASAKKPDSEAGQKSTDESTPKEDAPKLLKLVAEHWETASRVQIGIAGVVIPALLLIDTAPAQAPPAVCVSTLRSQYLVPHPPARGPPQF